MKTSRLKTSPVKTALLPRAQLALASLFAFLLLGGAAVPAAAEKADSLAQAVITYRTVDIDNVAQTRVLTGDVVVTRGTLVLKADKAVLTDSPEGYLQVTLTSAPGRLATFRQKRDGGPDLWIEGQAQRIEYEEKLELVKLFGTAKIRQLEGTKLADEIDNAFISYDSRRELFTGRNDASGQDKHGGGRGMMVLAPRKAAGEQPPAAAKP